MPAQRLVLSASLVAAGLALAGCAKPGLEAVPTVPWETVSPTPQAPAGQPAPTQAPVPVPPQGEVPTPAGAPETAPASPGPADAPSPAATPAGAPDAPTATRATTKSAAPASPRATTSSVPAGPAAPPRAAAGPALFARGATGDGVREIQARLKQLDWFEGPVTGTFGSETAAAVEGFQAKRNITPTGAVDAGTLASLRSMTRTPTPDELADQPKAGPALLARGATGDRVRELQARLAQIGWFSGDVTDFYGDVTASAVSEFQGKRGLPATGAVDQATWDKLVAMTRTPSRGELGLEATATPKPSAAPGAAPAGIDPRCMTGRVLCISKAQNKLRWMIDGQVVQTLDVRFGTDEMPTREGVFNVGWKSRDHVSTIYHTPMPYAMFFSGGQAVHYSADFAARGYNGGSHGCVNVRDKAGVAALFGQVRVGDKVVVHR